MIWRGGCIPLFHITIDEQGTKLGWCHMYCRGNRKGPWCLNFLSSFFFFFELQHDLSFTVSCSMKTPSHYEFASFSNFRHRHWGIALEAWKLSKERDIITRKILSQLCYDLCFNVIKKLSLVKWHPSFKLSLCVLSHALDHFLRPTVLNSKNESDYKTKRLETEPETVLNQQTLVQFHENNNHSDLIRIVSAVLIWTVRADQVHQTTYIWIRYS